MYANLYWRTEPRLELKPMDDCLFVGRYRKTRQECIDGIVDHSPAMNYIATIKIPEEFENDDR